MLDDGRVMQLKSEAIRVTHDMAGIEGLPADIEPIQVAENRYRVNLTSGVRLDIDHRRRTVIVSDTSGSHLILSPHRLDGYGEELVSHLWPNGVKGFYSTESKHRGSLEPDGTIRLSLAQGEALVIRFPEQTKGETNSGSDQTGKICEDIN